MSMPLHPTPRASAGIRGFTLLESLIAVSIIALAIAAPLFSADRAYVAALSARDQLIASYLAQEGVEYVRALRDNAYLNAYTNNVANASTVAWDTFLNSGVDNMSVRACRFGAVCSLDLAAANPPLLAACKDNKCPLLYLVNKSTAHTYTLRSDTGGTLTRFARSIRATDIKDSGGVIIEEKIDSVVTWQSRGATYAVTSTVHLTPWQ